jgi:hypothetical protein
MQGDFVIQLSPGSEPAAGQFRERVEQIDTGRSGSFQSLEELGAMIVRLLTVTESSAG